MVDNGGEHSVLPARGRLRDCPQGLLQEASEPAQHTHQLAAGRLVQGKQAAHHDHLHHRRPRQRRGGQDGQPEGGQRPSLPLAQSAEAQVREIPQGRGYKDEKIEGGKEKEKSDFPMSKGGNCVLTYWQASEASETLSGVTNGNQRYMYM